MKSSNFCADVNGLGGDISPVLRCHLTLSCKQPRELRVRLNSQFQHFSLRLFGESLHGDDDGIAYVAGEKK